MKRITLLLAIICLPFAFFAQVSNVVTGLSDPFDVVIEGTNAYVAEFAGNAIVRVNLTAPNPVAEDVVTGITGPTSLLFDGDNVYISQVGGLITRRDASDLTSNQVTIASGLVTPVSMVLNGNDLYFSEFQGGRIGHIDLTTGSVATVINNLNFPEQMVLVGDEIFFAHAGANHVSKFNITDTNPVLEDVVTGFNNPAGIHAVGTSLFVTEFINNGSIFRIETANALPTAEEIVTSQNNPFGVSFYDKDLYFVQNGSGILSRYEGNVLSIKDQALSKAISIFPNPSSGPITVSGLENKNLSSATIVDVTGRIVKEFETSELTSNTINFDGLKGIYFVNLKTTKGVVVKQFVIQ